MLQNISTALQEMYVKKLSIQQKHLSQSSYATRSGEQLPYQDETCLLTCEDAKDEKAPVHLVKNLMPHLQQDLMPLRLTRLPITCASLMHSAGLLMILAASFEGNQEDRYFMDV